MGVSALETESLQARAPPGRRSRPRRHRRGTVVLPSDSTRYSVTVNGHLVHLSAGQTEMTVG